MSLADIELPDMSGELPRITTGGNAMGQRGLKGAIDDALKLSRISGRSGVVSSMATRPVPPDGSVHFAGQHRRAGACAPLTPGGEEAGSRINGCR
jgi:hypothetical protein